MSLLYIKEVHPIYIHYLLHNQNQQVNKLLFLDLDHQAGCYVFSPSSLLILGPEDRVIIISWAILWKTFQRPFKVPSFKVQNKIQDPTF